MTRQQECNQKSGCDGVRDGVRSWTTRFFWGHQWQYFTKDGHTTANTARQNRTEGWRIYRADAQANEEKLCTCGAWRPINTGDEAEQNEALKSDVRFKEHPEALRFIQRYRRGCPQSNMLPILVGISAVVTIVLGAIAIWQDFF